MKLDDFQKVTSKQYQTHVIKSVVQLPVVTLPSSLSPTDLQRTAYS